MINSAKNIQYGANEPLFGCNLVKGMNMEQALGIIDGLMTILFKGQSLDCLDLSQYGIVCEPEDKSTILCAVLQGLLNNQNTLSNRITALIKSMNNVTTAAATIADEKVKATSGSAQAKYLIDILKGTAGKIKYDATSDTINVIGLTPIGARMTVGKERLSDFDPNGKGKVGTDLEGWQIRNGKNGTENVLGRLLKYVDDLANAGKTGGNNSITVTKDNIAGFSLTLGGGIDSALTLPIEVETPWGELEKRFGVGEKRRVNVPEVDHISGYRKSKPLNLTHAHSHNLSAEHINPAPTPIDITPAYVYEIPIQFIGI